MYAIHRNCCGDLYLWCDGRIFEIDPHPPLTPHKPSPTHFSPPLTASHPQSPPLHMVQSERAPCSQRHPRTKQSVACRFRAIRPTLVGYVLFSFVFQCNFVAHILNRIVSQGLCRKIMGRRFSYWSKMSDFE